MRITPTILQVAIALSVLTVLMPVTASWAEVVVIGNHGVAETEVGDSTVRGIFLGKKTKWEDGQRIAVVTLKGGPTHEAFLKAFMNKTSAQFSNFWKKAVFTGTGRPPQVFATESEVVQYVGVTEGAVGYIDATSLHEGVKVLSRK